MANLKWWEKPLTVPWLTGPFGAMVVSSVPLFYYGGPDVDTAVGVIYGMLTFFGGLGSLCVWSDYGWQRGRERRADRLIEYRGMRFKSQRLAIEPDGEHVRIVCRQKTEHGVRKTEKTFHAENEQEQAYEYVGNLRERVARPSSTAEAITLARSLKDFKR